MFSRVSIVTSVVLMVILAMWSNEKFARAHFEKFIKVDFEFDIAAQSIFQSKDPALITNELALYFDTDIVEQRTFKKGTN